MIWNSPIPPGPAWWRWGSRRIWVQVMDTEVHVSAEGGADPLAPGQEREIEGEEPAQRLRFARSGGRELRWTARTADRSVVVRPAAPLTVLTDARAEIFVSTPLWIGMKHKGAEEPFFEVPSHRPSNTWFGPTPQAGELAYSTRSRARSSLDGMPFIPGRAVTRVCLVNRLDIPWRVERLKVPVPHLPLFHSPRTGVWTASVRIECSNDAEVDAEVEAGAPKAAEDAVHFQDARDPGTPKLMMRALGTLGWS